MKTKPRIEIDLAKVEQYAQVCDNEEEIALALGVSYSTLQNRKREFEEFANAIKRGKAAANIFVGGRLMGLVKEGNPAATIFWMKSRCGWKESQRLEIDNGEEKTDGMKNVYAKLTAARAGKTEGDG